MAKRDDNPHRLNLVIPGLLIDEVRRVAKERFGAKDNHLTHQPEISQTLLKLIRIGIDKVYAEDIYDESLEEKPASLQDKFNGLATELHSLKERVQELEQLLQTHIHTGRHLDNGDIVQSSIQTTEHIAIQIEEKDQQIEEKDQEPLPLPVQAPIHIPEQIDNVQEEELGQTTRQSPDNTEAQEDNSKQISVHTQPHIKNLSPLQETSETIETFSESPSGASDDTLDNDVKHTPLHTGEQIDNAQDINLLQIPEHTHIQKEQDSLTTESAEGMETALESPSGVGGDSLENENIKHISLHTGEQIEGLALPTESFNKPQSSEDSPNGVVKEPEATPTEETTKTSSIDNGVGKTEEQEKQTQAKEDLPLSMTQAEMCKHLGKKDSALSAWKKSNRLQKTLEMIPKYKKEGWIWNPELDKRGGKCFERKQAGATVLN